MNGLSQNIGERLKSAQELIKKSKQKYSQSPNLSKIIVNYRRQSLINSFMSTQRQIQTFPITELISSNDVKIIEIKRMIRKRLSFEQSESIQMFCRKKMITDLNKTVKDLRQQGDDGIIKIQVTKMDVF